MARKTGDYHAEHIEWLKVPENAAGYLNAVIEEDKDALLLALRNIAEAEWYTFRNTTNLLHLCVVVCNKIYGLNRDEVLK